MSLSTTPFRRAAFAWLTLALLGVTAAPALHAQTATKIFVASYGNDSNPGNSVSPKRNFQAAHDAVAAGGEIVVLDTAGYGFLTITKSVSLVVPPGVNGFSTATTDVNNITVNAGPTDVVSIRGLIIEGFGLDEDGNNGFCILVNSVGTLRVEDCTLRNFFEGIRVATGTVGTHVIVSGCSFYDLDAGIGVLPSAGTSDAIVTDCTLDNSGNALDCGNDGGTTASILTAVRCIVINSDTGLSSNSTCTSYADRCTFSGDTTALGVAGGTTISFGNNTFIGNAANGTFTSTIAAQ